AGAQADVPPGGWVGTAAVGGRRWDIGRAPPSDGRDDPHPFNNETSSADAVWRRRKMATRIPRPTTTSAAATTITKKTVTWPATSLMTRLYVTNERLTALSI